jgi:hypothetical protein
MGDDDVLHQYVDFYNIYVKEIISEQNTSLSSIYLSLIYLDKEFKSSSQRKNIKDFSFLFDFSY